MTKTTLNNEIKSLINDAVNREPVHYVTTFEETMAVLQELATEVSPSDELVIEELMEVLPTLWDEDFFVSELARDTATTKDTENLADRIEWMMFDVVHPVAEIPMSMDMGDGWISAQALAL